MTAEAKGRKRATIRSRVLMTGTVVTADGSNQVLVRDISYRGARICGGTRIAPGQDAYLRRGPIFVVARVAWCKNDEAGLHFYRDLTSTELNGAFHRVILPQEAE